MDAGAGGRHEELWAAFPWGSGTAAGQALLRAAGAEGWWGPGAMWCAARVCTAVLSSLAAFLVFSVKPWCLQFCYCVRISAVI